MKNKWIADMFEAQIVAKEGIVRRNKSDVHKMASFEKLLGYVRKQQYHLLETGDQYIVVCNSGVLQIHC